MKQRVLLANKFYYRRGGDCIYVLNLEQLLKDNGHEVAIFAMDYPENLPSDWSGYFPPEIRFSPGPGMIEALRRPLGTAQVKRKFNKLLDDFRPDIVHLNNIHSQLSPVIARIAHERGVKVVWTLHDYKLLCPRYDCLRNGEVCELCFDNKSNLLKHKCMKGSTVASALAYMEAKKWDRHSLDEWTDLFIGPSRFMADKMAHGGFTKGKISHLCNFIDIGKCDKDDYSRSDYYCYVGRLSHEKGVATLIEAARRLPYRLVIVGGGPLEEELKKQATPNIEFVGFKQWPEIKEIVGHARFTVVPSEWYENNPLSVIEALCLGTPVLGAEIGGIPELIDRDSNGDTFASGDASALKAKIESMWNRQFDNKGIARQAMIRFDSRKYYKDLMELYSKL